MIRKSQVMWRRCCLVCLKPGHTAKKCHSSVKYLICGWRQYALLCTDLLKAPEKSRYTVTVESLDRNYSTSMSLLSHAKICSTMPRIHDETLLVELATRGIKLTDVARDTQSVRVLLLGSILTRGIEAFSSGISATETLQGWTILGHSKE
ncbi:transposable element Tc1 transposase [Nephila pilipes]|uniref:Transposable element Tc1 transposase n=1 Tax=Nephila pilipes TaxID=299642 RepID=A0A8X6TIB1_NEPPI|nr:transposable element Tc1 transposase [Nephila pilipes]